MRWFSRILADSEIRERIIEARAEPAFFDYRTANIWWSELERLITNLDVYLTVLDTYNKRVAFQLEVEKLHELAHNFYEIISCLKEFPEEIALYC